MNHWLPSPVRRRQTVISACLAWTLMGCVVGAEAEADESVPADTSDQTKRSYRLSVSDAELASWTRARSGAPFLRGQSAVDGLILTKALADDARRLGLDREPRTRIEIQRLHGKAAFARLRARLSKEVDVDDAEIDRELRERPSKPLPERRRLRNLFLRFEDDDPADVRRRLEELRQKILDGADFEALARRHSQSETRWRGGLLGNVRPGTFPPAVDDVIQQLEPGQVSEMLQSADGLTLLYCERILPAATRTSEQRRRLAAKRVHRRLYEQELDTLKSLLMEKATVTRLQGSGSDGPAVRFTGAFLDSETLSFVVGRKADAAWPDPWPPAWQAALERFVVGRMALLYEAEQGHGPDADARSALEWEERRILAGAVLARQVDALFEEPTEDNLRRAFEAAAQGYRRAESYDLDVLKLPRAEDADDGELARDAAALLRDLRSGAASFEAAARRRSGHPSAKNGGRIAGLEARQMAPRLGLDVARAVAELAVGELSELVWSEDGIWILRLVKHHPERPATYEEAKRDVQRRWIRDELDRLQEKLVAERLETLDIR